MPNPPQIVHAGDKAFYSPMSDRITMPPRGLFENAEEYWSTFWHESAHASGHGRRLNRESMTAGSSSTPPPRRNAHVTTFLNVAAVRRAVREELREAGFKQTAGG
jgi:antirestriction protein ArdC